MLAMRELPRLDHICQRGAIKSTQKSVASSLGNIPNTVQSGFRSSKYMSCSTFVTHKIKGLSKIQRIMRQIVTCYPSTPASDSLIRSSVKAQSADSIRFLLWRPVAERSCIRGIRGSDEGLADGDAMAACVHSLPQAGQLHTRRTGNRL